MIMSEDNGDKKFWGWVLLVFSVLVIVGGCAVYLYNASIYNDLSWRFMASSSERQKVINAGTIALFSAGGGVLMFIVGLVLVILGRNRPQNPVSAAPVRPVPTPAAPAAPPAPTCPSCGRPADADALFCSGCGAKISRCPSCGRVLEPDMRFCPTCGLPIRAEAEVPDETAPDTRE